MFRGILIFFLFCFLLFERNLTSPFSYDFSNRTRGSMQATGNVSVKGNLTTSDFIATDVSFSEQLNSSFKISSDVLKYSNGYIEDLYVDIIEGLDGKITIEGDLYLTSFVSETIDATSFIVQDVRQWELHQHDDFDEVESLMGWSMNKTSTCQHQPHNKFLGGHCVLSMNEVSKKYEDLPEHKTIKINANFHFFDNWEGENVYFKVDDQIVWFKSIKSSNSTVSINICGGEGSDPKFAMPLDYVLSHKNSSIKLTFGSTLQKDACDASFGIDDVMIYLK